MNSPLSEDSQTPVMDLVPPLWHTFVGTLSPGAHILDVGGRLAPLATQFPDAATQAWRFDVTLAHPSPDGDPAPRQLQSGGCAVTLHPSTFISQLPFASASFDAIAALDVFPHDVGKEGLDELFRVAKPGAAGQLTFRHFDAPLVAAARWPLFEAEFLFNEAQTLQRLQQLVSLQQTSREQLESATAELMTSIDSLKNGLAKAREQGGGELLAGVLGDVEHILRSYRPEAAHESAAQVDGVRQTLLQVLQLPEDIVRGARNDAQMQALAEAFKSAGFVQVEYNAVSDNDGTPSAWLLLFERA